MPLVPADLAVAIYCIVASVGGLLGNGVLILLITTDKELRRKDYVRFILNRTALDFAFCIFLGTLNPIAILTTDMNSNVCVAAGFLVVMLGVASMCSEALLALNRYVSILKSQHYERIYTERNIIVMCAFSWLVAALTAISNLLNDSLGRSIGFFCSLKFSLDSLALIMSTNYLFIFAGLTCVIFCNWKMYVYLKKYQTRSMTNNQLTQLQNDREMIRLIFATAFVPFVLECPVGIVTCIDMVHPLSVWFMFAGNGLYLISFSLNPVITILMVRSIRKRFVKIVGKTLKRHGDSKAVVEKIFTPRRKF